ncbi:MAG: MFS transporter [Gammaproteobacteria bacterium]|nr:MFS transporter [Gammaproteobacteria bacterium]
MPGLNNRQTDAVFRKIAWRIMPFLMVCYLLALVDRTNIGFAKLSFMSDLGFSEVAYGFGAGIFYLGYLLLEVPSNLLLDRVGLRLTLMRIMVLWGICTFAMAFMWSPASFATLRFLLGAAEAGFFPGLILYLTYWITARRRAWFTALLMSCPAIAGMAGSLMAGVVMTATDGMLGLRGWQWLFVVEGAPTIVLGVVAFFYLADKPAEARWLSAAERQVVLDELAAEARAKRGVTHESLLDALRDARFLLLLPACFALYASTSTNAFWAASILRDAGATQAGRAAYLLFVPNAVGLFVQLAVARSSDRRGERRWHAAACLLAAATGWLLLPWVPGSVELSLFALVLAIGGTIAAFAPFFSLAPGYLSAGAAPAGIAIVTTLGSLAGFVMPLVIGRVTAATGSLVFAQVGIGTLLAGGAILLVVNRPPAAAR